jgi:hypothetical protein
MSLKTKLSCLFFAAVGVPCAAIAGQPEIVGYLEPIKLGSEAIPLAAKLDTGADVSSLHVTNLQRMQREDGEWVAFEVVGADNRRIRLERKVERIARVRNAARGVQERPTVLLGICLGSTYRVTEVNLADRSGLTLPVLVGRSFLGGRFAVDSSRTYTVEPRCGEGPQVSAAAAIEGEAL